MNTVGEAMLAICELFENGQVADLVAEHAKHVAELKERLVGVQDVPMKQKLSAYANRWTAAAIAADVAGYYDASQELAAELGGAGLL
ncbi:MAG: hypothetical protein JST54_11025 [Deltaproteobacteria bacterium]|nr:hypothetical protein [Deltaproteobacteria bacterium]